MNYYNLKRTSTDDINQNRKRRRTISNDMFRDFRFEEAETDSSQSGASDLSSISSTSSSDDDEKEQNTKTRSVLTGSCQKCANCKCDEMPKILQVQSQMLSILRDLKKQNEDFRKTVLLTMQSNRQEIIDEVKNLRSCLLQRFEHAEQRLNNAGGYLELMDSTIADENIDSDYSERPPWFR